jgi:hypothetical protein
MNGGLWQTKGESLGNRLLATWTSYGRTLCVSEDTRETLGQANESIVAPEQLQAAD